MVVMSPRTAFAAPMTEWTALHKNSNMFPFRKRLFLN